MNARKSSLTKCRSLIALVAFVAMIGSGLLVNTTTSAAGKKTKMDPPTVTCLSSTQVSITLHVCAGVSGAPAGFSIQWMNQADYDVFGWPTNSDCVLADGTPDPSCAPSFCKASFSGNANLSRYNLAANACVDVNIGEFLFDEGASTNCPQALQCGTTYVFRAFAHANSSLNRSDFTANFTCSTLSCGNIGPGCTLTQGYWKTHGPVGCATGNNTNTWTVTSLTLGTVSYTDLELCSIFNAPASGNGLIALAHQLIAAKLNIANGADGSAIQASIDAADALIGGLVVPPVGAGSLPNSTTSPLTAALTSYNEGATGPGHCD